MNHSSIRRRNLFGSRCGSWTHSGLLAVVLVGLPLAKAAAEPAKTDGQPNLVEIPVVGPVPEPPMIEPGIREPGALQELPVSPVPPAGEPPESNSEPTPTEPEATMPALPTEQPKKPVPSEVAKPPSATPNSVEPKSGTSSPKASKPQQDSEATDAQSNDHQASGSGSQAVDPSDLSTAERLKRDLERLELLNKLRARGVIIALAPVAMNNAFQKTGGSAAAYTFGLDIGVTRAFGDVRRAHMRRGWGVVIDYTVGDEKLRPTDRLYAFRVGSYGSLHFALGDIISLHGKIDPALRMVIDRGARKPMMIGFDVGVSVGGRIDFTGKFNAGFEIGPQFGALFGGDTNPGFTAALSTKLFAAWRFGKAESNSHQGQPQQAPADESHPLSLR